MKENFNDLTSENGLNDNTHDENGMQQQYSVETPTLPDSNSPDSLDSFVKKMKSLVKQGEMEVAHFQQLKENHQGLEDEFQRLQAKYQNLSADYGHLMDLHQQLEREHQHNLQQVISITEKSKKADKFIQLFKLLWIDFEKMEIEKQDPEPKYFSLINYFKFRSKKFGLTSLQIKNTHTLLQKKSKEVGYEMRNNIINGIEEIVYHSYVLRIILGF